MEFTTILQHRLAKRLVSVHYLRMLPGERFASLRKSKGFGQQRLAQLAGMKSDQAVSNFEQGRSDKMQPDNWRKIAEVFGMSLDALNDAVFGNVVIMTVPAPLGDAVQNLIEQFDASIKSATTPPGQSREQLDGTGKGDDEPDQNHGDENQCASGDPSRKAKRRGKSRA